MKTPDGIKIDTVKNLPLRPVEGCQVIHQNRLKTYRRGEWITGNEIGKATIEPVAKGVIY